METTRFSAFVVICLSLTLLFDTCRCEFSFDQDAVVDLIETSLNCHSNPAIAVAVVKDGKVIFNKGFGVLDVTQNRPVDHDTLFGIASMTKSFTASLFVKLLHEKTNLTVDSKVRELLGDKFKLAEAFRTKETTFADLLSHRTALLANNRMRYDSNLTRENILERLPMLPSTKQFRVDYVYNNLMYGLLSRLSEIIGGDRWENLVKKHLFEPLGMHSSNFATNHSMWESSGTDDNWATPYMELDGPGEFQPVTPELSRRWAEMCGSGSILSTSSDMTKWLHFHLSGGKNFDGQQVMSPDAFGELHKSRFLMNPLKGTTLDLPTFPVAIEDTDYAFALRIGFYRGYRKIGHSGTTSGYRALMTMLPSVNIGVVALLNGRDDHYLHRYSLNMYLLDIALGVEPWLNKSTICTYPEPWKTKPDVPKFRPKKDPSATLRLQPSDYKGLYHNEAYGYLTIDYNDTMMSLTLSYGYGRWELMLWPDSKEEEEEEERFFGKGLPPVLPFDVKPIYFLTHPRNDDVIVGVKATAFETNLPPVFCRPDHVEVCREAIFSSQTYNAGKCQMQGCPESLDETCPKQGNSGQHIGHVGTVYIILMVLMVHLCTASVPCIH